MSVYLGLDASTQSLTATLIEVTGDRRDVLLEESIAYDAEKPEKRNTGIGRQPGRRLHAEVAARDEQRKDAGTDPERGRCDHASPGRRSRERRVADTDEQIEVRRAELARLEDAVARNAFDFISQAATPEQRAQAVLDTKQAAERIGRLKSEIDALEQDRARYAQELETYRTTVAASR